MDPNTAAMTIFGWTPAAALGVLQPLAILMGGIWVLITFRNSNRIKSIETLIALEEEYRKHLPLLLEIECDYAVRIRPMLIEERSGVVSPVHRQKLSELDQALRHFAICAQTRNLKVDKGLLDITYQYYLNMLYGAERPELKAYIDTYWQHIAHWAARVQATPAWWSRVLDRVV